MKNEFSQENSEKGILDGFREMTLFLRLSIKNRKWPLKVARSEKTLERQKTRELEVFDRERHTVPKNHHRTVIRDSFSRGPRATEPKDETKNPRNEEEIPRELFLTWTHLCFRFQAEKRSRRVRKVFIEKFSAHSKGGPCKILFLVGHGHCKLRRFPEDGTRGHRFLISVEGARVRVFLFADTTSSNGTFRENQ